MRINTSRCSARILTPFVTAVLPSLSNIFKIVTNCLDVMHWVFVEAIEYTWKSTYIELQNWPAEFECWNLLTGDKWYLVVKINTWPTSSRWNHFLLVHTKHVIQSTASMADISGISLTPFRTSNVKPVLKFINISQVWEKTNAVRRYAVDSFCV